MPRSPGFSPPIRGSPRFGHGGPATAAPAPGRICRARRHHRLAATVDRQRQGDLDAARAALDPFDHAAVARARRPGSRGQACRRRRSARSRRSPKPSTRGALDLAALAGMPADEAHAALTALHGIGPWTADIYLLFCLGHADAWPAGDLALQEAARLALRARRRGRRTKDMIPLAETWRPWRGVAACLLWTYYRARQAARSGADPAGRASGGAMMAAELDGPRLEPRAGAARAARRVPARLRRRRQRPHRHRPRLAGAAARTPPSCRRMRRSRAARRRSAGNGFPLTFRDPNERWTGVQRRRRRGSSASSTPSSRGATCRPRRWRWSASARAP